MRWTLWLGLTASLAACRETVVLDESPVDGGGGFDGGPTFCSGQPTMFYPLLPEVIVAVDRSTGMSSARFGNTTVAAAVRAVLDDQPAQYQKAVHYGYAEFPAATGLCNQCGSCASVVPPTPTFQGFVNALHACDPYCGDLGTQRPTTIALTRSGDFFGSPERYRRYVLLITNGRPDCGSGQGSSCGDGGDAYNEIGQLAFRDVGTYVVVPGEIDSGSAQCFRDLATAGGFPTSQAPYYRDPQDPTELTSQIGDVLQTIARDACTIDLMGAQIKDSTHAAFYWGNSQIPHDRNNGWDLTDNGFTIVLHGQACDNLIQFGKTDFTLFASCNPVSRP